jgi:hypothetical protein
MTTKAQNHGPDTFGFKWMGKPNTCVLMQNHANLEWDAMVGKVSAALCWKFTHFEREKQRYIFGYTSKPTLSGDPLCWFLQTGSS